MTSKTEDDGFTLIELLVVILVLAVLAGIAIPTFLSQRDRAWLGALQADLRNAAGQMELYYRRHNEYPTEGDISFLTGPDVTLRIVEPAGSPGQVFCITGAHARLNGGAVALSWDSDGGGQVDGDAC